MLKSLVWKESREVAVFAIVAVLVEFYLLAGLVGLRVWPISDLLDLRASIPFIGDVSWLLLVTAGVLAVLVGLWQTMRESAQNTWAFLLHRPIPREQIVGSKLAVGAALVLLIGGVPLAAYSLWAATPGTHASPFFWAMTVSLWYGWLSLPLVYLGAFLSGLRPGRWSGSRYWPMLAALVALFLAAMVCDTVHPLAGLVLGLVFAAILTWTIFYVARSRDFS